MTDKEKDILSDLSSMIVFGVKKEWAFMEVLANVAHDVGGLINKEEMFLPRSDGYTKHLEVMATAALAEMMGESDSSKS